MFKFIKSKIFFLFSQIWFLWGFALLLNIITFLIIFYKIEPIGKNIILHYNAFIGPLWQSSDKNLYYLPLIGIILLAINFTLFGSLKSKEYFLNFLPGFVSVVVSFLILIKIFFILYTL